MFWIIRVSAEQKSSFNLVFLLLNRKWQMLQGLKIAFVVSILPLGFN